MISQRFGLAGLVLLLSTSHLLAEETPLLSRVNSIDMFKNGLAVVHRTAELPGSGVFVIEDVPAPIHGTFWISSEVSVTVRVTQREVEVPLEQVRHGTLQDELAGRRVTIRLRDAAMPVLEGTVLGPRPAPAAPPPAQPYLTDPWGRPVHHASAPVSAARDRFLLLQTDEGRVYVEQAMIVQLLVHDAEEGAAKQRRPVLLLTADGEDDTAHTVHITYMTRGIAWAPSYRVNLLDSRSLSIEQQAVVRNELMDLEDVELRLISGFPSVQFSNVTSPLAPGMTWQQFIQQLNVQQARTHSRTREVVSQVVSNVLSFDAADMDFSALAAGEGVDLHYRSVGAHALAAGDALSLRVAEARADYDRIIEWIVPDTRDPHGRPIGEHVREQDPERYDDSPWDAVRFRNPFDFPITTAAASIFADGRFNGQRMLTWASQNEMTTLRINKSLSVRTRSGEVEEEQEREFVDLGGRRYRRIAVAGQLAINNHRNEEVRMMIRRQFSGDLLSADLDPRVRFREEGVWAVNRRNELVFDLKLAPGEEKTVNYRYSVLVPH